MNIDDHVYQSDLEDIRDYFTSIIEELEARIERLERFQRNMEMKD